MSSVYYKIGQLFKEKETEMVNGRVTQVNTDTSNKDSAVTSITDDKNEKITLLDSDIAAAKAAKEAALEAEKSSLATAIAALLTNATAEVDSITDLINYLNANNSDWTTTLSQKQTDLTDALSAHNLSVGDFSAFEAAWGVIYTRSTAAVPSTDLVEHFDMGGTVLNDSGQAAGDGDIVSQIGDNSLTQTNAAEMPTYKMYSHNGYSQEAGGNVPVPVQYPCVYAAERGFDYPGISWTNGFTYAFSFMPHSKRTTGGTYRIMFSGNDDGVANTHLTLVYNENMEENGKCLLRIQFRKEGDASCQKYDSLEGVLTPHEFNQITVVWDGSAAKPTVKVNGTEVEFGAGVFANVGSVTPQYPYYGSYGPYGLFGDFAYFTTPKSGNDLDSLEAYLKFKHVEAPVSEPMFQDVSTNYAGGFGGTSTVDADYIKGVTSNTACYAYPTKYFKLGTRAEMTVTYAAVHASNFHQYFIVPRSKWNFQALARSYDYVPAYQVRYSPGSAYGVYHRNYGSGQTYAVETGDNNFAYLNSPGEPVGDMYPGDTIGFIVEWDGTMKLTQNGAVIFTYPDKLTEDFVFAPIGVFGDWKLDMSGDMVDFDAIADIYGERFEGAELVTPTVVLDNGIDVSLGGINANAETLNSKFGNVTLGSLQGAGSYIEFVNANEPVGPHQEFEFIIDTDSSNFTFANAPYGIKRYNSHESQFYKDGAYVEGNIHFCSRPFFGEWPYWHPAEYWETHGDDDTVANKTVGPCRIQLMEGNKLVCFVNDYPVWEQSGFDVTQKWYFNLRNYKNNGASFENIKIKSVQ